MREALALVKRDLGEDAIILGTRSCPRGPMGNLLGRSAVEITAAPPDAVNAPPRRAQPQSSPARPPALPEQVYPYYQQLVQNEVAEQLALRLARQAGAFARQTRHGRDPKALHDVLRRMIARLIPVSGGVDLAAGTPRRVALVGPAGGGKTTTLAKLAAHFKLRLKRQVVIVSLDMQRLGSNEQLRRYAEVIGVPMYTAQTVETVEALRRETQRHDLVLIDTHGVCAADQEHFARLAAVLRAARPDEVHLALSASMMPSVQQRMAQRFGPLGVTGVILTHLDEAVGLGVILNALERLEWGLSYITTGERVPNHIEEACAERMAALILPAG
jgi:flagellar biosynthesis protein FlhF